MKSQFGYHIIKVEEWKEKAYQAEIAQKTMESLRSAATAVMDPAYFGPQPTPLSK